MFRSRYDHISELIDLYQRLDSSNISTLIEDSTSITEDIEKLRGFLKTEIESFTIFIIDGLLGLNGTMDIKFIEKVIEFNPNFVGETLSKVISKFYLEIGFKTFFKMITNIKNNISSIYAIEALFNQIIVDGEKHRDEACELTTKLQEISSCQDFNTLSTDLILKVENMIESMKPHARPIIRKNYYHVSMPLKEGDDENGVSYPIFSKNENWAEHHLVMSQIIHTFNEQHQKVKKILKK
ncbi:uncharacterized protein LOC129908763 [Episyrphus balteatus]|uniref:uncharacterized protein LOC129908763 n=1 Tax=Episyrphus balteatus TaxID=286459 RepID=UPI002485B8A2|nr:uncharacterized protein LOC129908763 [Episyrphus balteatus]